MSILLEKLTFKDIIEQNLKYSLEKYKDNYEHEYYSETHAYGDTYVSGYSEITEESIERATEEWKDTFDVYDFLTEFLAENEDFKDKILEMVDEL